MVAGLIFRMQLMPVSDSAQVGIPLRLVASAMAFIAYLLSGKRLDVGVLAGGLVSRQWLSG